MNQRLIWNFELSSELLKFSWENWSTTTKDSLKWEIRYFWPESEIVRLQSLHEGLLEIANYQHKHRDDYYYLLPKQDYNIKRRGEKLLYKPLIQKNEQALGFGEKINLDASPYSFLNELKTRVQKKGTEIHVKKEVFIYSFLTTPKIKLELSKLEVQGQMYLSACIEGRSATLVKKISQDLLPQQVSCEYVHFLKQIRTTT